MSFELPDLGYDYDALEPHLDALTMEIHHTKHHNAYTNNLNAAIAGTEMADKTIEELISHHCRQHCNTQQWWWILESSILLADHVSYWRWRSHGRIGRSHRFPIWFLR